MIMYKSPFRVSLFGGGTDYRTYLETNDIGMCIGFAIDKYSYVSVRELPPFFKHKIRAIYSEIEQANNVDELKHNGIKNALIKFGLSDNSLEIHHSSDLPTKTGLGTSSAFLVALSAALYDLKFNDAPTKTFLGAVASAIEQSYSNVGMQDHYFSSYGEMGELCFHGLQKIEYVKYHQDVRSLFENNGLLFFTGIERNASDVVGNYINKIPNDENQSQIFDIASQVSLAIYRNKLTLAKAGQYLHDSWECKKKIDPSISNDKINYICDGCLKLGAIGVKLCGAGLGGTIYLLSEPKFHNKIIEFCINEGCIHIPFNISESGATKIL